MDQIVFHFLALFVLILVSGFFSGSEAALFSLTRSQVKTLSSGSTSGRAIAFLLETPRSILVSILLGNLIVNIFATSTATALLLETFGEKGLGYAFLLMSAVIIAFGEILPKALALRWAEPVARGVVVPLRLFHMLVFPVRVPLSRVSDWFIALTHRMFGEVKKSLNWEELLTALRISHRDGALSGFEFEVLTNVIEFRQKIVREIMTPSIDVVSASVNTSRRELLEQFSTSGYSRIPIHDASTDDIIGILHIKDMLEPEAANTEDDLRDRLRETFYVQEGMAISTLYNTLQTEKLHFAVVQDEYTSMAGIVTTEDILEELVGDIRDARDPKTEAFMRIDDKRVVVAGSMEIDDFNDLFESHIEDDQHDTIAGFVLGEIGKIPRQGETLEIDGFRFHIVSAQPNRIRKMRVERV